MANKQLAPTPMVPQPIQGTVNNPQACGENHINIPGTVTTYKNINPNGIKNSETYEPKGGGE